MVLATMRQIMQNMIGLDTQDIAFRPLIAAIASVTAVGLAIGLGMPLLSIIMQMQGHSSTVIGANTAIAGLAGMAVAPYATRIAQYFGLTRALLAAITISGISFLCFAFTNNIIVWFALRAILHIALALIFIYSEVWINSCAPPAKRGFVFGIYATVLSLGFAGGPMILAAVGSQGILAFAIGSGVILAALIPVFFAIHDGPKLEEALTASFYRFLYLVPVATFAVFVFGIAETSSMAIFPVFGLEIGYSEANTALLLTMFGLGNVFLQIPLGIWSDRINDRRKLLCGCGLVSLVAIIWMPFIANYWLLLAIAMFFLGGLSAGLYTIGLAHLGSRLQGSDLAAANSAFVFCYALGSLIGPPVIGGTMDAMGANGFPLALGLFFLVYVLFVLAKLQTKPAKDESA